MRRHRRPYAENPCLVGRGGDYPSLAETADNDRFPAKRWLVTLLDRRVKGIEVEVEHGGLASHCLIVLRASGIARRRTEEERAEAFFLCERRRRRRIPRAMREQLKNLSDRMIE
jgi:hypothetical protein